MGRKRAPRIKDIKLKSCDFTILILVMALVVFGIIMVFSASYYHAISNFDDPYHYLKRDIVWALSGGVLMAVCALLDYRVWQRFAIPLTVISVVMLLLIFTPLGVTRNNATRWIGIGSSELLTIMPGEIAKIAAIVFVAWFLSQDPTRIRSFSRGVLPVVALMGLYAGLIIKQPNLSTALTVCGIMVGMLFVAGLSWKYIGLIVGAGVSGIAGLLLMDKDGYWVKRIMSFTNPFADKLGDGYQVVQGLLALGSGGAFGVGLGQSIQKTLYLPEPQNDFILAIIGEELGLVGVLVLMGAYLFLIWRGIHVAVNARDMFGTMLASGIVIMIAVQVILNVAVVTSSMPPTGVTLPFVSYGGNALWLFMGAAGILLNISRHTAK